MPIKNLNETTLTRVCHFCQAEEVVPLASLVLGQDRGGGDPDLINLPTCTTPNCGASEILKRTWDSAPDTYSSTGFYQQRATVNALAQRLRTMGRSSPGCQAIHDAEVEEPPQRLTPEQLQGAGHNPQLPDMSKGAAIWAARQQSGGGDIHPSKRLGGS